MAKKYKKGMFIGRFQPFHLGHLSALKFAMGHCDELVLGIGSSNKSGTADNPLDKSTRISVIYACLKDASIDTKRISFFHIPDFDSDEDWYNYINSKQGKIDAVFSGNEWVLGVFRNRKNVDVLTPPMYKRAELSGTAVRARIRAELPWEHLLTSNAADVVSLKKGDITAPRKTNDD